jgi:hypothetical protein
MTDEKKAHPRSQLWPSEIYRLRQCGRGCMMTFKYPQERNLLIEHERTAHPYNPKASLQFARIAAAARHPSANDPEQQDKDALLRVIRPLYRRPG